MRFWDSSALIPLLVGQPASTRVDDWLHGDPAIAIWTLTPVELSSALQRLLREGSLTEVLTDAAEKRMLELVQSCHLVVSIEHVKSQARRLLRLHPLRAADGLQLAAAVEWAGGRPQGRTLHTFDTRLAAAARREGFEVPV
jgi:predicted nucleic acid-binding protein